MTKVEITKKLTDAATPNELRKLVVKLIEENIQLRQEIEKIKQESNYGIKTKNT